MVRNPYREKSTPMVRSNKLTWTSRVPSNESDEARSRREDLNGSSMRYQQSTWTKRSGVFRTRCFEGDDVLEMVWGEMTISWCCSACVRSINRFVSVWEWKWRTNGSSVLYKFRLDWWWAMLSGESRIGWGDDEQVNVGTEDERDGGCEE